MLFTHGSRTLGAKEIASQQAGVTAEPAPDGPCPVSDTVRTGVSARTEQTCQSRGPRLSGGKHTDFTPDPNRRLRELEARRWPELEGRNPRKTTPRSQVRQLKRASSASSAHAQHARRIPEPEDRLEPHLLPSDRLTSSSSNAIVLGSVSFCAGSPLFGHIVP